MQPYKTHAPAAWVVVIRIFIIIYIGETLIMGFFYLIDLDIHPLYFALLDALLLGVIASPLIYFFVIKDFIQHRIEVEQELYQIAHYDWLTKLPNRLVMYESLQDFIHRSKRTGHYGALLFLDIDDFKIINEKIGLKAGDKILRHIASSIKKELRDGELCARVGGDEFVIILSHLSEDIEKARLQACIAAERMLESIQNNPIQNIDKLESITVSAGISIFPHDSDQMDQVIKYADLAMYVSKKAPENKVHFYSQNSS